MFDTFRPKSCTPASGVSCNVGGRMAFVSSTKDQGIEVYFGTDDGLFDRRGKMQTRPLTGVIRFDGDRLTDFLLYERKTFDPPLQIGRDKGCLPD